MNPRVRIALRCIGGFVAAFAVVLVVGGALRDDDGPDTDTVTVADALRSPSGEAVAVRGYLFFDPATGPLLCSQRTVDDPPACEGALMAVVDLDPNRLDLVRPDSTDGAFDAWSRDEVALLGVKLGAVLQVQDVLR